MPSPWPEAEREEAFTAWLEWAKGYAARLDPLTDVYNVPKVLEPQRPRWHFEPGAPSRRTRS